MNCLRKVLQFGLLSKPRAHCHVSCVILRRRERQNNKMKLGTVLPTGAHNFTRNVVIFLGFVTELCILLDTCSGSPIATKRDRKGEGVTLNGRMKAHGAGEKCPELRHCTCKTPNTKVLDITCEHINADQLYVMESGNKIHFIV